MTVFRSGLYHCRITHARLRPRRHRLRYGAFYVLLDLDELDTLHRKLRGFSVNAFNWLSFFDRDHGPGANRPLRPWIEGEVTRAGIDISGGRIEALCLPRVLGYAFNPLTVYFCYDARDRVRAIMYEVNNTFGERHHYLFEIDAGAAGLMSHQCAKRFYVSPFMEVSGSYQFRVRRPEDTLALHIHQRDAAGPLLDARIRGERVPLTARAIRAALVRYPLLTLKIIAGIHWEALRLWLKGTRVVDRPAAPPAPVTTIRLQQDKPPPVSTRKQP